MWLVCSDGWMICVGMLGGGYYVDVDMCMIVFDGNMCCVGMFVFVWGYEL